MLRSLTDLKGFALEATDGGIGHLKDVYFDDEKWVVRYLVVDTGSWLSGREVLISPFAVGQPDWAARVLPVSIRKEQVRNSPDADSAPPVSRQHEIQYLRYYGYPYYWGGIGLWGGYAYPAAMMANFGYGGYAEQTDSGDPHLRSWQALLNYHIKASDGEIGHLGGLLIDEDTWAIRYLIVNTSNWWLGHEVLVAPQWIQEVRWLDGTIAVDLTRQSLKDAPRYHSGALLSRNDETGLYRHHARAGYWGEEVRMGSPEFGLGGRPVPKDAIHKYT
jgi:hypothetical protein